MTTMRWFIICLIIIFLGLGILVGYTVSISYHIVDAKITEMHRANLMIIYDLKE